MVNTCLTLVLLGASEYLSHTSAGDDDYLCHTWDLPYTCVTLVPCGVDEYLRYTCAVWSWGTTESYVCCVELVNTSVTCVLCGACEYLCHTCAVWSW